MQLSQRFLLSILIRTLLSRTMSIEEYGQLASVDGEDGRDNLRKLLYYATKEKHSFLFINFKAPPEKRFMLRFERYLTVNEHE